MMSTKDNTLLIYNVSHVEPHESAVGAMNRLGSSRYRFAGVVGGVVLLDAACKRLMTFCISRLVMDVRVKFCPLRVVA